MAMLLNNSLNPTPHTASNMPCPSSHHLDALLESLLPAKYRIKAFCQLFIFFPDCQVRSFAGKNGNAMTLVFKS